MALKPRNAFSRTSTSTGSCSSCPALSNLASPGSANSLPWKAPMQSRILALSTPFFARHGATMYLIARYSQAARIGAAPARYRRIPSRSPPPRPCRRHQRLRRNRWSARSLGSLRREGDEIFIGEAARADNRAVMPRSRAWFMIAGAAGIVPKIAIPSGLAARMRANWLVKSLSAD